VTTLLSVLAIAALAIGGTWLFGSFVLRWGGAIFAVLFLVAIATNGDPILLWGLVPAIVLWLIGHRLYEARHGHHKSRLAMAVLDRLSDLTMRVRELLSSRARSS